MARFKVIELIYYIFIYLVYLFLINVAAQTQMRQSVARRDLPAIAGCVWSNSDSELITIEEVAFGKTNLVCPFCDSLLTAKKGRIKTTQRSILMY